MDEKISLVDLLAIIRKKIGVILIVVLTTVLIAFFYTFYISTPQYQSTTQLLVNQSQERDELQSTDIGTNIQLISTYTDMLSNYQILNTVSEELALEESVDQLKEYITVSTETNSQIFSINVSTEDSGKSTNIANASAIVLKDYINSVMNMDNVIIISEATTSTTPVSPNKTLNLVIGAFIGSMVGIALVVIPEFFDTTIKDEKFIGKNLNWVSLGSIPEMTLEEMEVLKSKPLTAITKEAPVHSEG